MKSAAACSTPPASWSSSKASSSIFETRKKAEVYRETTQRLLASVFGVVTEPLAVADQGGKLIMANTAVTRRLGWSIFDLMGNSITNVVSESDRAQLAEIMESGTALDQTARSNASCCPRESRTWPARSS